MAATNKIPGLSVDEFAALVSATFDTSSPHLDLDGAPSPFVSVFEDDSDDDFFTSHSPSPRQLPRQAALNILRKVKSKATNIVQGTSASAPLRSQSTDLLALSGTPLPPPIPAARPIISLSVNPRGPRPRSRSIPAMLSALGPSVKQARPSVESPFLLDDDSDGYADTTFRPSVSRSRSPTSSSGDDWSYSNHAILPPQTPNELLLDSKISQPRPSFLASLQSSPGKRSISSKLRNLSRGKRISPFLSASSTFLPILSSPDPSYTPTSDFLPTPSLTCSSMATSPTATTSDYSQLPCFDHAPSIIPSDDDYRAEALEVDRVLTPDDDPFRRDEDVHVLPSEQSSPSRTSSSSCRAQQYYSVLSPPLGSGSLIPVDRRSSIISLVEPDGKRMTRSRSSPMLSSPDPFDFDAFAFPSPPDRDMAPSLAAPLYSTEASHCIAGPQPLRPGQTCQRNDSGSTLSSTTLVGRQSVTPTPSRFSTLRPPTRPSSSSRPSSSLFLSFPLPPHSDIRGSVDGLSAPNVRDGRRSPGEGIDSLTVRVVTPISFIPPPAPPPNKPLPSIPPSSPASLLLRKKPVRDPAPPSSMKQAVNDKIKNTGIGLRIRVDSLGKRFKRDDRVLMVSPSETRAAQTPEVPLLRRELWADSSDSESKWTRPRGIILETSNAAKPTVNYGSLPHLEGSSSRGLSVPSSQSEKARKTTSVGSYATTDTNISSISSSYGSSSSSTSATSVSISPGSAWDCKPEPRSPTDLVTVSSPVTSSAGLPGSPKLSYPPYHRSRTARPSESNATPKARLEIEDDVESYYSALSRQISQSDEAGRRLSSYNISLLRGAMRSPWCRESRMIRLREDDTLVLEGKEWNALTAISDAHGGVWVIAEGFGDDWDVRRVEVQVLSCPEKDAPVTVTIRLSSSLGTRTLPVPLPRSGLREDFWYAGLPEVPSISPIQMNELGTRLREENLGAEASALRLEGVPGLRSSGSRIHDSRMKQSRTPDGQKTIFEMEVPARLGDILSRVEKECGRCVRIEEKSEWFD